ncbi:MAG: hypothetical protein PHF12_00340 [Candidatus Omnitrophica bacterium]|nr:hypothetical protein [Candidatus Omnitrophota bacterium]
MVKNTSFILCVIALIIMPISLTGCNTNANSPGFSTNTPTPALSLDDQTSIYAVVVRQLATRDDTFGGKLKPSTLYIVRETNDKAGDPTGPDTFSTTIPQSAQNKITETLRDLASNVMWIDKFEDAEFEEGENSPAKSVKDGGAIITLGNARLQKDGSAQVAGCIYVGSLAAGGATYVLEKKDGVWEITGTTGARWIS